MLSPTLLAIAAALGVWAYGRIRAITGRRNGTNCPAELVVIVGASSGIGKDLVARRTPLLAQVAEQCRQANPLSTIAYESMDITKPDQVQTLPCRIHAAYPQQPVDTLILCAGVISVQRFVDFLATPEAKDTRATKTPNDIDLTRLPSFYTTAMAIFNANAIGLMGVIGAMLPLLHTAKSGRIVVVSSAAGRSGAPTRSLYAATKHALHGFIDSLRIELLDTTRTTICTVCPGTVATDFRQSAVDLARPPSSAPLDQLSNGAFGSPTGKLTPLAVAQRMMEVADNNWEREVFLPRSYAFIPWLQVLCPTLLDTLAARKYRQT
ncbi:hypothetical protein H4R34_000567 [Dimargaris verticillata]|uniref:Uncharacterized protein n=1 Tax=Dimargaris verticillata TaxID=2761393 RepID=A0A9W8EBR6_9FUNG|nr:hypothetical protein H4R34_000567 [Dimargaris verticillata]